MATPPPPPPPPVPPPPPPSAPPPPPPSSGGAPAKGGNKTLIIILCVLGGMILLIGGCVTTCAYFATKKAKEFAAKAQKNPQFTAIEFAATIHPDIEILSRDEVAGKITLRNKKTGETVTINANDYTRENIGQAFEQFAKGLQPTAPRRSDSSSNDAGSDSGSSGNSASSISPAKAASLAATVKKLPDYMTSYPGATTIDATVNSMGATSVSNYEFSTSDAADAVVDAYEKKLTAAGFTIAAKQSGSNDSGATSTLAAQRNSAPSVVISVSAEADQGRTHVTVTSTAFSSH